MIKGTTSTGFRFKYDENNLDWEVMELISDLEINPLKMVQIGRKVLGKKQYENLKKFCTDENGKIPVERMDQELTEIILNKKVKN